MIIYLLFIVEINELNKFWEQIGKKKFSLMTEYLEKEGISWQKKNVLFIYTLTSLKELMLCNNLIVLIKSLLVENLLI